jgi:glycosyltransferase involved in cell wall biosynthesis
LFLVGDGEEKGNLRNQISRLGLNDKVKITGFMDKEKVALYYNAADVVLVGSLMEGWSIAMVEALACGKTIVSTNVSGTNEMIKQGVNGFIIEKREKKQFVQKMEEALKLPTINEYSVKLSKKYSLATLKNDIEKHWKPDNVL